LTFRVVFWTGIFYNFGRNKPLLAPKSGSSGQTQYLCY
jgi:hypothetical protein